MPTLGTFATATAASTVYEGIITYESQNSPAAVNEERVRDGSIGVWNQAQIGAESCDSGGSSCTSESYSGIYLFLEMDSSVTLVSLSISYESWGEDGPLGEEDPSGYGMYVTIDHKFDIETFLIESYTTSYDNMQTVSIGDFPPHTNGTLIVDVWLYHTSTSSLSDEANARIHEVWTDVGPSDADADGVADTEDACANTPSASVGDVDETGCVPVLDQDQDGVADAEDQCPGTPPGESVDATGCSPSQKDSDGDGISDSMDDCPNTASQDTVDSNGCSASQRDSDGDGVSDSNDNCPNTSSSSSVDFYGCAPEQKDSDGDGVSDADDACPDTPTSVSVNAQGCSSEQLSSDEDGDGVPDASDECPGTGNGVEVEANGCPVVYVDTDGDGHFDDDDAFPSDGSQWVDTDGDGYGDNQSGFRGDACLTTFGRSSIDRFGCPDTDQDGVSDENDAFPLNPTQVADFDSDGFGDNQSGTTPDAFPEDATQHLDTDGDGYGDNASGSNPDACPLTIGTSTSDRFGCPDEDNDGVSDANDQCDATELGASDVLDEVGCLVEESTSQQSNQSISESPDDCVGDDCVGEIESETNPILAFVEENQAISVGLTAMPAVGGAVWAVLIRKGKGRTAKRFFRLARAADDLAEVVRIRGKIDDLLADGKMDGHVHANVSKLLNEREAYLAHRLQTLSAGHGK